jgi:hypothetical protein
MTTSTEAIDAAFALHDQRFWPVVIHPPGEPSRTVATRARRLSARTGALNVGRKDGSQARFASIPRWHRALPGCRSSAQRWLADRPGRRRAGSGSITSQDLRG